MLSINSSPSKVSLIDKLTQQRESQSEKLASGKRINKAADDAAGFQIANRLTSQINQDKQLSFNAQDQVNINNVEASAFASINESLLRAEQLSIQSGNPLYNKDAIQGELDQISEQINAVASGILGQEEFISGLDANDPATTQSIISDSTALVNDSSSTLGAQSNALASQVATYETSVINVSASRSRIEDTDYEKANTEQAKNSLLLQSTIITTKKSAELKGMLLDKLI